MRVERPFQQKKQHVRRLRATKENGNFWNWSLGSIRVMAHEGLASRPNKSPMGLLRRICLLPG